MKKMEAIKTYFEQKDAITPQGGRKVETRELLDLKKSDANGAAFDELATLAAAELGAEVSA